MLWPLGLSCPSLHWLVWKLRSQERCLFINPSSVSANCYKNTTRVPRDGGGWVVGGFLILQRFVRNTDSVLSVTPCRRANCSACKWQFRWRMIFYRGDKLQVSLVALGERFRAACQLAEWEPGLWLTAAPDRAQSSRSADVTGSRSSLPMKTGVCSECPAHLAFSSNDDDSLESMANHPFFFLPISLFNEMMNDVVSPSRTATHTILLPGVYTFTDSCVGHFSLISCCCLYTAFLSFRVYLCQSQVTFSVTGSSLCGLYLFWLDLGDCAAGS